MNLVQRVQAILLRPGETWPVIDGEPATAASIYRDYLVLLAAIAAVAGFVGSSVVGIGPIGAGLRVPLAAGLVNMVFGFAMPLVGVFVMALIVDALAPTFGGGKNPLNALKLVAYGSTACFVGGIFNLVPALSTLGLLAALYSIYLIYVGLPVLMKCPPDRAAAYTAVVVICGVVAMIVLGALATPLLPGRGLGPVAGGPQPRSADVAAAAARADALRRGIDAIQATGAAAASSADSFSAMANAISGGGEGGVTQAPIDAERLKTKMPDTLGSLKRESLEASGARAPGIASSFAKAGYAGAGKHVGLTITDFGGAAGSAAMAAWADVMVDRETPQSVDKAYRQDGRTIHEDYRKDGSHSEYTVILRNNVIVAAEGDEVDIATLKAMVSGLGLGAIEAMARPAR